MMKRKKEDEDAKTSLPFPNNSLNHLIPTLSLSSLSLSLYFLILFILSIFSFFLLLLFRSFLTIFLFLVLSCRQTVQVNIFLSPTLFQMSQISPSLRIYLLSENILPLFMSLVKGVSLSLSPLLSLTLSSSLSHSLLFSLSFSEHFSPTRKFLVITPCTKYFWL